MSYVSSMSMSIPIQLATMQLQSQLTTDQTEVATEQKANIGQSLGARTGSLLSLQSQMDQLNSYTNTNNLAATRLSATSSTLTSMLSSAQDMAQSVTEATGVGSTSTLQTSAQDSLESLVGNLNTSSGGEFIFGGINTGNQPVTTTAATDLPAAANTAFQTYLNGPPVINASTMTSAQMQTFLNGSSFSQVFTSSGGTSTYSQASNTLINSQISPSQSLTTSVSANNSAIGQVAQAYTMLSAFAGQNISANALSAVTSTAAKLISSGTAGLNNLASGVGIAQSTVTDTNTQISSQVTLLTNNVSDLNGVDPTALSTQVSALTTQLEASYELTQKLSQLSLVNYLTS